MSETSKWDDYFVRVGRYLEYGDIESEELEYKRETAHELARYRDELLSRQTPITIKPNKDLSQLAGWRKFPDVLKWLSTDDGADALRELWARYDVQRVTRVPPVDDVIERVRRFSIGLPKEILQGSGTRMRPISVLLMALDAEQYPVFMTTAFDECIRIHSASRKPGKDADEAGLYSHAITFLDRFIEEAERSEAATRLATALRRSRWFGRFAGPNGTDENEGHMIPRLRCASSLIGYCFRVTS